MRERLLRATSSVSFFVIPVLATDALPSVVLLGLLVLPFSRCHASDKRNLADYPLPFQGSLFGIFFPFLFKLSAFECFKSSLKICLFEKKSCIIRSMVLPTPHPLTQILLMIICNSLQGLLWLYKLKVILRPHCIFYMSK